MANTELEPLSPELVLVSPELRAVAFSREDAESRRFTTIPPTRSERAVSTMPTPTPAVPAEPLVSPPGPSSGAARSRRNIALAAAVYLVGQIASLAAYAASVILFVVAVLVIAELIHH